MSKLVYYTYIGLLTNVNNDLNDNKMYRVIIQYKINLQQTREAQAHWNHVYFMRITEEHTIYGLTTDETILTKHK